MTKATSDLELLAQPPPDVGAATPLPNISGRVHRILLVTDGTAASDGALAMAGLLARRDGMRSVTVGKAVL